MTVVEGLLDPDELESLLALLETPPDEAADDLRQRCESLPYAAIDPTEGDVPRYLKYLLNQIRYRALEVVAARNGPARRHPSATALRVLAGSLEPSAARQWFDVAKVVVPLDRTCRLVVSGRSEMLVLPGGVAVVDCATAARWSLHPDDERPWMVVTMSVTDQLEHCEL